MIVFLAVVVAIAAAYQLLALAAVLRHLFASEPVGQASPGISILKPIRGLDPEFYESIRSHALLDYPEYEILFGLHGANDPAAALVERLRREFPERDIRTIITSRSAPNGKVGVLMELSAQARHPILFVNDSDICVQPDYLRRVSAPLADGAAGLVTCLYRARANTLPGQWEALGIATDFMPSTLVAPLVGVKEFGLGSTLAFRAADLERIGGFAAVAGYLADDYQLARRITELGQRAVISKVVVETRLGDDSWRAVWKHQLRWARTIRLSRGDGYAGLPVTHAGLWALVALAFGAWWLALPLLALRMLEGFVAGWVLLRSPLALRWFVLVPLWDVWAFAVWIGGYAGNTVEWRGQKLKIDREGRILPS